MNNYGPVPSWSFYGRKKSHVSDSSDSFDEEDNLPLSKIREKELQRINSPLVHDLSDIEEKSCDTEFGEREAKLVGDAFEMTSKKAEKTKYQLPPPPQVSDMSDTSDEEENLTVDKARKKKLQRSVPLGEYYAKGNVFYCLPLLLHPFIFIQRNKNKDDVIEDDYEVPNKKGKKTINFNWTKEDIPRTTRDDDFTPVTNEEILCPLEYFTQLLSFDIINDIIDQTNLYSTQTTGVCIATNPREMTDFISILLYMGVINLPSYEDYWCTNTRIEEIASLISLKRFKLLRRYIHFNNNQDINENTLDRFFKIRPFIDKLRRNFQKFHTENQYSVDETIVAYKGTRAGNLRQYIKNKPHKWGYKFFVIAGISGYILDFIPYQGANTCKNLQGTINELTQEECEMGVGAGIVIALSKSLHDLSRATLFFDNYFAGLPLFLYLKEKMNIHSLGTLRSNRIAGCPIETDKVLQKQGRGHFDYKTDKNKGFIVVKWVDNKAVLLGSTVHGIEPTGTVKRFNKYAKEKVDIPCPAIVKEYNKYMGGVDTANALMGLYKTPHKAKRWYFSIFSYLLDVCVVNAWLLYRMDCAALKQKHIPLKRFRLEISASLAKCGKESRRGRPSSSAEIAVIQRPVIERPDSASRFDCYGHWPVHTNRGRCRNCVRGTSRIKCEKCNSKLCLTETKNCFKYFHSNMRL